MPMAERVPADEMRMEGIWKEEEEEMGVLIF